VQRLQWPVDGRVPLVEPLPHVAGFVVIEVLNWFQVPVGIEKVRMSVKAKRRYSSRTWSPSSDIGALA